MGSKGEALTKLRLLPAFKKLEPKGEGYKAPELDFKIPKGAIVELLGSTPKEYAAEFLVLNEHFVILWGEKEQRVFPPYFVQRGFDVTNITFATYGENVAEGIIDVLRGGRFDVVVAPNEFSDVYIDRFGRLCREVETILMMIGKDKPSNCIHIDLQLEIHRGDQEGRFKHEVLKRKHGRI